MVVKDFQRLPGTADRRRLGDLAEQVATSRGVGVQRPPAVEGGQLRRDVGQAARLRRDPEAADEAVEGAEDPGDRLDGLGRRVDADDRVAAAE